MANIDSLRLVLSFCHSVAGDAIAQGGSARVAGRRLLRRLPQVVGRVRVGRELWEQQIKDHCRTFRLVSYV